MTLIDPCLPSLNLLNDVIVLDKKMVCLCVLLSLTLKQVGILAWSKINCLCSHVHLLSNYTKMAMMVLRSSSLNLCLCTNSVYVVLSSCFTVLFLNVRIVRTITISPSLPATRPSKHNTMPTTGLFLSSSSPWKTSFDVHEQIVAFFLVILCVSVLLAESIAEAVRLCLNLTMLFPTLSHLDVLSKCMANTRGAIIFVKCVERCHVDPGRTESTCV